MAVEKMPTFHNIGQNDLDRRNWENTFQGMSQMVMPIELVDPMEPFAYC